MRRNPKPRTVWRCLASVLLMLRTRVTRIFLLVFSAMVCQDLFYRLAALGGNLFRRHHRLQALHGGPHKVDGVVRPDALGQDIMDAHRLEHRAHGAACNYARTFRGWLHVYARAAVARFERMPKGSLIKRNGDHVATRTFHGLLDGQGHFRRPWNVRVATWYPSRDAHGP